ncbi:hypothetical protein DFJ58DRAFT_915374 [Suillus subalutaceus]|uniref:uncharacterized protein n=1 Tax=Suillus subalutaceus TaxID=48586 RepID=UPI001B8819B4|nr:uncharacterized protein DFJ58DRAFT_915374 [Suillus subalutaceus]KAG1846608.1 hypothetical protein DFJ58DRAFT_915374 [Suillus subalutaceus]
MRKGNSSRNSTQQTHTSSEGTARESSNRPRSRVGRLLEKVKDGANKLRISRSKNSRSRSLAPPDIEVQAAPSGVEVEADTQSALRDAHGAAKRIHPLSGPVMSVGQDAQADLDAAGMYGPSFRSEPN